MNGDDFQDWVRTYRDRVYSFAYYTLRHPEDAEDVTQEVLVRLWNHRRRVKEPTVLAWLLRVTKNACFDTLRRRQSRRKRFDEGHGEELADTVASTDPDPHADAEADAFQRRLESALRRLPETYRAVVVLREIEGLKYDEIVEVTGRPLSTVKVYLHRGRKMLRQELGRAEEPAPVDRPAPWPAERRSASATSPAEPATEPKKRLAHA